MSRPALATLAVLLVAAPGPARAAAWIEPSTAKVLPGAVPSGLDHADLSAIRGEHVAFQAVIAGDGTAVASVDAALSVLSGPGGATIPAGAAALSREYFVDLTGHTSWCDSPMSPDCADHPEYLRNPGWYPDPLIPFTDPWGADHKPVGAPFDVAADGLQVVWVDLAVPAGIPAGRYEGTLDVTAGGAAFAAFPVSLEVLDVDLPVRRTVVTAFNFSVGGLSDYHGGPDGGDAATRERIFTNYEALIHDHRIDFSRPGPRVTFTFGDDGHLVPPDYAAYDAYWTPRVDGTRFADGAPVTRWDLGMFKPGSGLGSMTAAQYAEAAANLADHLRAKGFLDHVYLYGTDEPWMPDHRADDAFGKIAADVERLHEATDAFDGKALITGPWQQELDPYVGIWCPDTAMYDADFWPPGAWADRAKYADLRAQGRELWFYVCNQNFPALMGYDADSPVGFEPRLVKWGAWYEGATGFLYWRLNAWIDPAPWAVLSDVDDFGAQFARNGDGILVYPGDHDGLLGTDPPTPWPPIDGPLSSLRLEAIRDGLEDWELFKMAADLGGEAFARRQVERVYHRFGAPLDVDFDPANRPWSLDDADLRDARRQVALKVQFLLHPDRYPDPEGAAGPDGADGADEALPDAPPDATGGDAVVADAAEAPPDGPGADAAPEVPLPDVPDAVGADVPADPGTVDALPDAPARASHGCSAGGPVPGAGLAAAVSLAALLLALAARRLRRRPDRRA